MNVIRRLRPSPWRALAVCGWLVGLAGGLPLEAQETAATCQGYVDADVVALDQPFSWNRFGAVEPQGMMYALARDVVPLSDADGIPGPGVPVLQEGQVQLRRDKRPRPLILRVNVGQCLRIRFTNLLDPVKRDEEQPATRAASVHVLGLPLVSSILDDGSDVGLNTPSGVVDPGKTITYTLYAPQEGTYVLHSMGAIAGGEGDSGSIASGLFGAVNVEPKNSEWYRSQVTEADLRLATTSYDAQGFPVIDYNKKYTSGPYNGLPILKMLDGGKIVHSDLTAIITGPNAGNFDSTYPYVSSPLYPQRKEPFREFSIIFHDEIGAVQAFPQFEDRELSFTLHSARDGFAINYGTGGIGAEILANRLGVGPAFDCAECKYEEFFLTSWALGDPAMVVDRPANAPCTVDDIRDMGPPNYLPAQCTPTPGRKATRAFYPDDPSNVYHSYLNDHVKFRNSHAGSDDHHIFHLHAHQWTHTPKSDLTTYLDSQAIGQGGAFTYEIAHEGSGNLNHTAGDSIFHCHFYPHFAQGMWSLWRVHDVLELGTPIGNDGRPKPDSRALPDNEILAGTPIPGLVPIPVLPMAPLPGKVAIAAGQVVLPNPVVVNPGFPFFIPGLAGRRPPHPPLDTIHDGGLPRHVAVQGSAVSQETRLDFSKVLQKLEVRWLDESGEQVEKVAMDFHNHPGGYTTPTPKAAPTTEKFWVNSLPPAPGAPYADPCSNASRPIDNVRRYKAADIEVDTVLTKAGWHFPQQRMITLWQDVKPTLDGSRPPEPFFFRAHSGECIEFWLTNLVPHEYQVDDFQVRTPTDILGQHIHLVKFDVTSSDGAANGFNYEDGSFSPGEVRERIEAIRAVNGCPDGFFDPVKCPEPEVHPYFGLNDPECEGGETWLGAQTTVQRWYADPITTLQGGKRTLRTVFTHDHFGPSTHQQAGLYAGLIVEKEGTSWAHNETGVPLSTRNGPALDQDGGPTSWQAAIQGTENFREFMIEFADFQLAYEPGGPKCPDPERGFIDPRRAINPPGRKQVGPPLLYEKPDECPVNAPEGTAGPRPPCPEAVSADDPGIKSLNYRSEPIALRVLDTSSGQPQQTAGLAGDLSFAYETRTDRADPEFNTLPYAPFLSYVPYPALTSGLEKGDPFTPLLRSYEGDPVKIRVLVGAHEESHNFAVHGLKWLSEPDDPNSGWRGSQMMGISQWFDLEVGRIPTLQNGRSADFLYTPSASTEAQWDGIWGLLRAYRGERPDLVVLQSANADAAAPEPDFRIAEEETAARVARDGDVIPGEGVASAAAGPTGPAGPLDPAGPIGPIPVACPSDGRLLTYNITAVSALEVLRNDPLGAFGLVYNSRQDKVVDPDGGSHHGPLADHTAIMFVYTSDLNYATPTGRPLLKPGIRREPLILRASAGDCLRIRLKNDLPVHYKDAFDGWNAVNMIVEEFNTNQVEVSREVGLHPQMVALDVQRSDGANIGLNPSNFGKQTVAPGELVTYYWYAGGFPPNQATPTAIPIEFGATNLSSSDPIKHSNKGAIGALIIEPPGSSWTEDIVPDTLGSKELTRAQAQVTSADAAFHEFVLLFQDDLNLRYANEGIVAGPGDAIPVLAINEDPEDSGQKALNYRTDPLWYRAGWAPETPLEETREFGKFHLLLSNQWIGGADPETPVFWAKQSEPVRFRVLHPGGHTQPHVFDLHGHVWEELPYVNASRRLGANANSEWKGSRDGHGPTNHFDALLKGGAGGPFSIVGDYLYRDYVPSRTDDGQWGIFRVHN